MSRDNTYLGELKQDYILDNPYFEFNLEIDNNYNETVNFVYNYFHLLDISNINGVKFRFGGRATPTEISDSGIGFALPIGRVTDLLEIQNRSGAKISIKFALALGKIDDSRLSIVGAISSRDVGTVISNQSKVSVGITQVLLAAANANRKELLIYNDGNDPLNIGATSLTANMGFRLDAKQSMVLSNTAAVYALRPAGAATADVFVMENLYE